MGSFKQTFLIVLIIVIIGYIGMSLYSASAVNSSVNRAKLSAAYTIAYQHETASELYCLGEYAKNKVISSITTSDLSKLLIKGTKATAINFNLSDICNLTSGTITINGYKFTYKDKTFTRIK